MAESKKPGMINKQKGAALLALVAGACALGYQMLTGEELPAGECPEVVECPVCPESAEPVPEKPSEDDA